MFSIKDVQMIVGGHLCTLTVCFQVVELKD